MRKMEENDLPCWPSKGNRRKLDELWLEKLECDGTSAFLTETPAEAPPELYKALEEFNGRMFWSVMRPWRMSGVTRPIRYASSTMRLSR